MRFVNKVDNYNTGFTENDILILSKEKNIHPQNNFQEFLRNAGKKSNVFDTEFKNLKEYINFQKHFESIIKKDTEISLNLNNICCLYTKVDCFGNTLYYFIETEKAGNSQVLFYSDGNEPIGVNFKDERVAKIGLINSKTNFSNHLKYRTELKFGKKLGEKIRSLLWTILTFPIWLPILIYLEIRKRL